MTINNLMLTLSTFDCSAKGAVVGATMAFCTRPTRTLRRGLSCSGAAQNA